MKKILFFLIAFVSLFVIGCQENLIIDPVTTETFNKEESQNNTESLGTINLQGLLLDPSRGLNSLLLLNGSHTYAQQIVFPQLPPEYEVSALIRKDAQLQNPLTRQVWNINEKKDCRIYLATSGEYVFEDHCIVSDRLGGLALVCRYLITTTSLILEQISLVFKIPQNVNTPGGIG